jgi:DHA2 family multidrug resistance protein
VATSFIWAPLNTLVLSRLDPRVQDQGYALYYLNFDLGSSIGTAAVIGLHARMAQVNHAVIGESVNPYNELFRYPEIYTVWDLGSVASLAALQHEIGRQATMIAYNDAFMVIAGVMLSLIPFIVLFRHRGR